MNIVAPAKGGSRGAKKGTKPFALQTADLLKAFQKKGISVSVSETSDANAAADPDGSAVVVAAPAAKKASKKKDNSFFCLSSSS